MCKSSMVKVTGNNLHNHWGEENIFVPAFPRGVIQHLPMVGFYSRKPEPDGSTHPLLPLFLLHSPEHLAGVVLLLVSMVKEKTTFFHTKPFLSDLHAEMIQHREGQTNSERERSGPWQRAGSWKSQGR